jgi:hypothetical protein
MTPEITRTVDPRKFLALVDIGRETKTRRRQGLSSTASGSVHVLARSHVT